MHPLSLKIHRKSVDKHKRIVYYKRCHVVLKTTSEETNEHSKKDAHIQLRISEGG